jgi:hypothetical protein
MKRITIIAIALLGLAAITLLAASSMTARATASTILPSSTLPTAAPQTCNPSWSLLFSPNANDDDNTLSAVAALSDYNAWAVGWFSSTLANRYFDLIQHWDGVQWSNATTPSPGTGNNFLRGIKAIAPDDIWAVGDYTNASAPAVRHLLTIHWNGTAWYFIPNPDPGGNYTNFLNGVDAVSSTDVWTVGFFRHNSPQALTMHWDGGTWTEVDIPPTYPVDTLNDVYTFASNDVWAVGSYSNPTNQALAVHWNGSAWSIVATPVLTAPNSLSAVAEVSPTDVWAVGTINSTSSLVEHWNGSAWSVVTVPEAGSLHDVTIAGPSDIWAVGDNALLHYDGSTWSSTPNFSGGHPLGIDALSPSDIWAVGSRTVAGVERTMVERYLSSCITPTPTFTPRPTATYGPFCQVSFHDSITSSDPVQTGILTSAHTPSFCSFNPRPCPGVADNLPRHYKAYTFWNPVGSFSTQCVNVRIDTTACSGNIVSATYIASFDPNNVCSNYLGDAGDVIVGSGSYEFDIFRGRYLVVVVTEVTPNSGCSDFTVTITPQYECFSTPTPTFTQGPSTRTPTGTPTPPSPIPTSTPTNATQTPGLPTITSTPPNVTYTPTPIPATDTPAITATSTACAIAFSDVPPGSTFYPFVRCLACLGIVQGYPNGTYRPNNSVTRGQASKIISGSAGYTDPIPPTQQTFNDVLPDSTFWLYIERVALHDAIQGYPCGGPGEPCPGSYFRPNNTLTRGQAAKIVSITANYNDPVPPQQQTFTDVPPNSTFWLYIERIALHNVVSGYPDGTYRPNNPVTRGQLAKIAANAFFPGCSP